eukprot:m.114937 g.114937  ORF g.114937 m.114937 type:complete len:685 (-) comp28384_c1_seq1:197-2251(-)
MATTLKVAGAPRQKSPKPGRKVHTARRHQNDSGISLPTKSEDLSAFYNIPKGTVPLLVFINSASGGKLGDKLLPRMRELLGNNQVFDLMERETPGGPPIGPNKGLLMHGQVDNLAILVCGGDGTAGWVLAIMDKLKLMEKKIPVGVLPLGTGNDLARVLKTGKGFTSRDDIVKALCTLSTQGCTLLDRWFLKREELSDAKRAVAARSADNHAGYLEDFEADKEPPVPVWNNYFEVGMGAFITLKFHTKREAEPAKFSNRLKNKVVFTRMGFDEILASNFKNFMDVIELECDGRDYTQMIREKKLVGILFMNIGSHAAGSNPWGTKKKAGRFDRPRFDDKKVEVMGILSGWTFAKARYNVGHAFRICQCSSAKLTLLKPAPIQMDGEPRMMEAGVVTLGLINQATMLCTRRGRLSNCPPMKPLLDLGLMEHITKADDDDDDDTDSEDDIVEDVVLSDVPVFMVHLELQPESNAFISSSFSRVTTVNLADESPLVDARKAIQQACGETLGDNWVFVRFEFTNGGRYSAVRQEDEVHFLSRMFSNPTEPLVRSGFYVTVDPTAVPQACSLREAILSGDYKTVVSIYNDLDASANNDTSFPLHVAATMNQCAIMLYLLLEQQLSPNITNDIGQTPLHSAALGGHKMACSLLLKHGASTNIPDNSGKLPQDVACGEARSVLEASTEDDV